MTLLKIAIWNANGLSQHKQEVQAFLSKEKIDVMLISETHFTTKTFFKIKDYHMYDTKHPDGKAHGGTAILVKQNIKHFVHPKYKHDHIQATSIVIEEWAGTCVFSAIYCPPKHAIKQQQFTNYFQTLGNRFFSGGDLNAKHTNWGSRLTTTKGKELWNAICENSLKHFSTGCPTYWPTDRRKIPDLIDFCISRGINENHVEIQPSYDLSSDHSPIIVMMSLDALKCKKPQNITNKQTNWQTYRENVIELIPNNMSLRNNLEIDAAIDKLTQIMIKAAKLATPLTTNYEKDIKLARSIRELISEKRKLRKKFQQTRSPTDKANFNKAIKLLKQTIIAENDKAVQSYLQNLTPTEATDYSLWKATKKLKANTRAQPPIRKNNGVWARSDEEKAIMFAKHLSDVFTPHEQTNGNHSLLPQLPPAMIVETVKFSIKEVTETIKQINIKKSPGVDLVSGKMIKELPEIGIRYFTYILNASMKLGFFPTKWKIAIITMIPKPGKVDTQVASYRPISLLPIMSKLFEKLILRKLQPIIEQKSLIPEHQFGCRKQHATVEQVHRVADEAKRALEEKKYCSAVFLDVAQAFDKVWHEGLLHKIEKYLPTPYFNLLHSYLRERMFKVKHHEAITNLFPIKAGVPQGSVLGSFLYQLYTADLPISRNVKMATFVDDTALMSTHINMNTASRELQNYLNEIEKWLTAWRMKVNETKSVHTTFTMKKKTCPGVSLNSIKIPQATEVKYLGLHLDKRLTWKKHITVKSKQLKIQLSKMYWIIGRRSKLSLESKLLLYKAILKPIWTYGIQLWGATSNSNLEVLQRFQSKTLRCLTNAPWYISNLAIHRDLQVETVKEVAKKYSSEYQERLRAHPNLLAYQLLDRPRYRRLRRADPLDLPSRWPA